VAAPVRWILTRPAEEAERWRQVLSQGGQPVVSWPLIDIQAAPHPALLQAALQNWTQWAAVMFVSRAAVQHLMAWRSPTHHWASTRCWATGPGTQQALLAAGVPPALVDMPDAQAGQFDTEHLWQVVQHQVKPGQQVLLVRGTEADAPSTAGQGRDWLSEQLSQAGVQVQGLASYVRSAPVWDAAQCAQASAAAQDGSIWLFSSSQALRHLHALLPEQHWGQARALVTHPRIAETAQQLGWGVVRTSRPSAAEIRSSLECFA
jgi:uroporphyrinogen-III synthase